MGIFGLAHATYPWSYIAVITLHIIIIVKAHRGRTRRKP